MVRTKKHFLFLEQAPLNIFNSNLARLPYYIKDRMLFIAVSIYGLGLDAALVTGIRCHNSALMTNSWLSSDTNIMFVVMTCYIHAYIIRIIYIYIYIYIYRVK